MDVQGGSELGIPGVERFPLVAHADPRGALTEIYRRAWLGDTSREAVQANLSESHSGVLRGLHVHRRQSDYWCVLSGTAFVGLVDLRPGSATRGRSASVRLSGPGGTGGGAREGLFIPPGVAHGFYAETDVLLLYLVDAEYDGSDELGLAWDDPEVGIAWPNREPVLSDRDRSNPPLAGLLETWGGAVS